ncbi:gliding motility-associated C-terminal domain-containing protein [Aurantibacillus circumpalustris]|uniref:T9SS type B sorting domain-containing protein n=1 Tax=Aurantibacillus circumpalustris TaxID=3036359 RepID=UPI00295BE34A|nr:gliding motility-associated C-terminal domain-containing protein [Aurantibacillus circumpalustris]
MKNPLKTLSLVVCILISNLNAQTSKTNNASSSFESKIDPTDPKATYINTQNYLSTSTLKDYRNYYGDSLKGFDEAAVKAELISRLYYGQEFISVMAFRKRDYIDQKYKLGEYAAKPIVASQPIVNTKQIGGQNFINVAPCVNEDFEATPAGTYNSLNAITGWSLETTNTNGKQLACGTPTNAVWVGGSPEFSIVTTPILGHPYIGNILNSPLGGNRVAVLNNTTPGFVSTRLSTTFPVTTSNSLFQFAYAGSWDGSGHQCCDQPFFTINMFDCSGAPLACSSISLTPPGSSCMNGATGYSFSPNGVSWTNWQLKYIDLTPYIGSCVTIRITNGDCNGGAHHGSLYFDSKCGGTLLCSTCTPPLGSVTVISGPVSFCAGSGSAQISAPTGYATYSWVAPPFTPVIPVSQATLQTLSINSPTPGLTYSVYLTSPSGCQYVSVNTLSYTTVNISGIASGSSCAGGASGSATVIGNGSGTGYNYTWLNSTNSVVGTSSIVTGLAAGIYSIGITGFGSAGCGSAITTVTIGVQPPGVINQLKPFCGNIAYIVTGGGTNFQWYNGSTAIPSNLGGTSSSLTITNPTTGSVVTLTYLSSFGCLDSVRYTLAATNPGFLSANSIPWICPGGNNGTAVINLIPALGGPAGLNTFNINSIGNTPVYNISSGPSNQTSLPLSALSAGTYSVHSFDGSCHYGTTFNVNAFTFNYTLSPNPSTLCPGNSIAAGVTFTNNPSLTQYSYSWSPTTWLAGNNGSFMSTIISPTLAAGTQSTLVYTVVVTPSTVNCPVTKTISITAANPATPIILAIPELCNNSSPVQILTSAPGGTYSTSYTGANSPVSQTSGLITPSHSNIAIGTNSFVYSISINTCVATKSGTYNVSQYNTAALTSAVPPLCVTNSPFNLMNIVQYTVNGSWTGQGVSNNQFVPTTLNTNTYPISYNVPSFPNPLACPSTTLINVAVTKTITPTIIEVPEFCSNKLPFTMTVTPSGGSWFPSSGINSNGAVTPSNITVPNLTVTYSVNVGPCLNIKTSLLNVSQFIPATLTNSLSNLCYNSGVVNLMSIVQNTAGTWKDTTGVLTNSFFPSGLTTNVYTLSYKHPSAPNATLCPDTKTIAVSLLNPPMPSITQVAPICNNANPIQLQVTPLTGNWTGTSYLSSGGVFTPSLSSVGNNAVKYVIGTAICNRQQTKQISVEAFVPATITSKLPDLCNNSPVMNLTPFTANNQGTWGGAGITGTNFNPNTTGSGNFILTYHTASSPSGLCPDEALVTIKVFSLAVPSLTKAGPYCTSSLPVQLQVSPIGGVFGGSDANAVSNSGKFNPASALIGNNQVTYSITSGPCIAYAKMMIQVEKFISSSLDKKPGPFCKTSYAINLNSYVLNTGGEWSMKDAGQSGLQGNMFHPDQAIPDNKTTLIYTTFSEPTRDLCPDKTEVTIEVRNNPIIKVTKNGKSSCAPAEFEFYTSSVNTGDGTWSFNDGSEVTKGLSAVHLFMNPGIYQVQYNYKDDIGCEALPVKIADLEIHDSPKANFTFPEEIYISEPRIQLSNLSKALENNSYYWEIKNLLKSNELAPSVEFSTLGKYQITLTATSAFGCKDEITKTIEVKNNFNVFIPNSFSPNFDGLNDVFAPVFTKEGLDTKYFEMQIFDRWGHLVYQSKDITKGWDGSLENKGEAMKEDTYVFKIKYKDAEGNLYEKAGNIALLK